MDKKKLLVMASMLSILGLLYWHGHRTCSVKQPCQCFCAFKPGLRDKEDKDTPFIASLTNSKGKTFNICLCAQRDLDHLQENPELIDLITEEDIASANCCK